MPTDPIFLVILTPIRELDDPKVERFIILLDWRLIAYTTMSVESDSDLERIGSMPLDPEILSRVNSRKYTARRAPWHARTTDFQQILLNSS